MTKSGPETFYGDKFDQLLVGASIIQASGGLTVDMFPVEQASLDAVAEASGLPYMGEVDDISEDQRKKAEADAQLVQVPDEIMEKLIAAATDFSTLFNGPLILRSSARGDAVGVGVYESVVHGTDEISIREALAKGLASYYGESARMYREHTGTEPGFAMFIQPVVGTLVPAYDRYESVPRSEQTHGQQVFSCVVSGNVRIGTPRHPEGSARLQRNYGCAVNTWHPNISLEDDHYQDMALEYLQSELSLKVVGRHAREEDDTTHFEFRHGTWQQVESSQYIPMFPDVTELSLSGLAAIIRRIHAIASTPQYLEFVVTPFEGEERLFVVQKADLKATYQETPELDSVNAEDIIVDNLEVHGETHTTTPFTHIVCLTSENHSDLYAFDKTEQAQGGYLLAYHASRVTSSRKIDLKKLRNVRAVVDIETQDWGHALGGAESHLIGYSDELGVPLLMAQFRGSETWQRLNGSFGKGTFFKEGPEYRSFDTLLIREGVFRVLGKGLGKEAAVVRVV